MSHNPVLPQITEYLFRKATAAGIPLSGTFELTPLCNMDCKMCYVRMTRQQQESVHPLRTAEEWLRLAEEAKSAGMLYLLLTGGEPFLYPEFRKLLTELHKMGFIISINSNGTLIDEEVVSWLKEVPPSRINISLYGASKEAYRRLCQHHEGFTRTDAAIQLLKNAGIPVKLNCSLTPYNCADLPDIIEYAKSNELIVQTAAYMFPPLRRDESMIGVNNRFSPEEAAYYTAYSDLLIYGKETFLAKPDIPVATSGTDDDCFRIGEGSPCRAAKSSFWITWEGKMLPCGMFPDHFGINVFQAGFTDSWKYIKEMTDRIRLPAQCAGCNLKANCRTCAAMVYAESGCFDSVPRYRCQMTESLASQQALLKQKIRDGSL